MWNWFFACPSPSGRGRREAAGEGENAPSSGPSGHLLPEGEGHGPRVSSCPCPPHSPNKLQPDLLSLKPCPPPYFLEATLLGFPSTRLVELRSLNATTRLQINYSKSYRLTRALPDWVVLSSSSRLR